MSKNVVTKWVTKIKAIAHFNWICWVATVVEILLTMSFILHHGVVHPSKSMAVSTTLRQAERSAARWHAVWRPQLGLRSASTVRSQDWRGRPLGQCQSSADGSAQCACMVLWILIYEQKCCQPQLQQRSL